MNSYAVWGAIDGLNYLSQKLKKNLLAVKAGWLEIEFSGCWLNDLFFSPGRNSWND